MLHIIMLHIITKTSALYHIAYNYEIENLAVPRFTYVVTWREMVVGGL